MGALLCAFSRIAAKSQDRSWYGIELQSSYMVEGVCHIRLQERWPSARTVHLNSLRLVFEGSQPR